MKNDEKLREQLSSAPVPDKLRPENIKIMLDKEAPKKKRSGISMAGRITAAAAACAVIGGTAVYTTNNRKFDKELRNNGTETTTKPELPAGEKLPEEKELKKQISYMSGASDYDEVYMLFKDAAKKAEKEYSKNRRKYAIADDAEVVYEEAVEYDDLSMNSGEGGFSGSGSSNEIPIIDRVTTTNPAAVTTTVTTGTSADVTTSSTELITTTTTVIATTVTTASVTTTSDVTTTEADPEHSDTYYQEQDVLEADIVKTDGKHIYYVCNPLNNNSSSSPVLRVADVKDGKFTGCTAVDIKCDVDKAEEFVGSYIDDMYIYNDMIAVIGINNNGIDHTTFAAFYTTGDEPELIDVYYQDGSYSDVRITPDGYMFLTSAYSTRSFSELEDKKDLKGFIPSCGFAENYDIVAPEDILLPEGGFGSTRWLSYTVIGSIDLNEKDAPEAHDVKTLAGYAGSIYCSADNLYTASSNTGNTTDITRISIKGGDIIPQAGCTINGTVKDQFSMSEYNGYFRVAATYTETKETFHRYSDDEGFFEGIWDTLTGEDGYYTYEFVGQDTRVYILDMDLNMVGCAEGLGEGETLKSASFSGDMAYIVTFRQTDPLYAVDLSNPAEPAVLDEFKINGFSTYMQKWDDGLLFGFGQDADENGRITGIRMTMFDNSDPNNLKAEAVYTWSNPESNYLYDAEADHWTEEWYSSFAVYERKALLIAPEKNLIGVPIQYSSNSFSDNGKYATYKEQSQYVFFSYENGEFVLRGDITNVLNDSSEYRFDNSYFDRALYIGNYVYVLSDKKFVAADIDTLDVTDELKF